MRERVAAEGHTGRRLEFDTTGVIVDAVTVTLADLLRPPDVRDVRPQLAEPLGARIPAQAVDEPRVTVVADPANDLAAGIRRVAVRDVVNADEVYFAAASLVCPGSPGIE